MVAEGGGPETARDEAKDVSCDAHGREVSRMIVGSCFNSDVDMALAGVQHDLYFLSPTRPDVHIDGLSTLSWIWANVIAISWDRGHPWLDRNFECIKRPDREGFSHRLLQVPHEHIAAYFRWTMPRVPRRAMILPEQGPYPMDLLEAWKAFLKKEIPDLLSSNDALVSLAKSIVYQSFEEGDRAYHNFQDFLMRRYGFSCVEKTGWAVDVARRVDQLPASAEATQSQNARSVAGDDEPPDGATYGCSRCWPESSDSAWESGLKLEHRRELIDDSHFHVMILRCPDCGQSYVWVFSELIDWESGDDSQGWIRMPLAGREEAGLMGLSASALERELYRLGQNRRSLWRIHPRGCAAGCSWGLGILPLPHD